MISLFIALAFASGVFAQEPKLTEYVNPFVGTDFHGHTFPGATYPFGMVQLSPDTRLDGWDGCSGYHYSDDTIYGFSHTHLSGTGCSDYGDVLMMPVIGYDLDTLNNSRYCSTFDHSREKASPGYYEVLLDKTGVLARLTAGRRMGIHSYTFPKGEVPSVIIDLQHRDILLEADITTEGKNVVKGFRRSDAWALDQRVYFYIEFSQPIQLFRPLNVNSDHKAKGALITFGKGGKSGNKKGNTIIAKIGISSVSCENAKLNLHSESGEGEWDFDAVKKGAEAAWEQYLSKIEVSPRGENREELSTFYTALYHTAIAPNLYSDVNGEYLGMDRKVHRAEGFERYTVFSLWDTFRALHPLFTIIERDRTVDFIKSFLSIFQECGKLPVWELSGWETNCMIGYNSVSVIADAIAKGIDGFDVPAIFEAMYASSLDPHFGLDVFRHSGLVPADKEHESVSKTLEYAYDDWCVAQVAKYLYDKTGDEKYLKAYDDYSYSALFYRNVFDTSTGFMRPRLDGRWLSPFKPNEVNNHFTEANSWQYSFFVPQDIEGHIVLLGGDSLYCDKIDGLFAAPENTSGRTQADITGQVGQYAHGNEPSHHIAYLYSYAGKPWKTQQMTRRIIKELYSPRPDGLCGNDDCGQMSAWYVMSAMGLYSVTPGSDIFVLTTPIFDSIAIHLENGKQFNILSREASKLTYIDSMERNGVPYTRSYITMDALLDGGSIKYTLSDKPNITLSTEYADRPHSSINADKFIPNPWFEMENNIFLDSMSVSMAAGAENGTIFYRIGEEGEYVPYKEPLSIKNSCSISAYFQTCDMRKSFITTTSLNKINKDMKIELRCSYNPQYNAGGDDGLIDGRRGNVNWRTGGWQGYQNTDFTAVIDLLEEKTISEIGAGFCQDARSWIWMPRYVEYYISKDGVEYQYLGTITNTVDAQDYEVQVKDFVWNITDVNYSGRYVKVFAKNFGTIPQWHLGAGGEGFIFVDEIWVK